MKVTFTYRPSIRLEFYVHFEFASTTKVGSTDTCVRCLLIWCCAHYIARGVEIYLCQVVAR